MAIVAKHDVREVENGTPVTECGVDHKCKSWFFGTIAEILGLARFEIIVSNRTRWLQKLRERS